MCLNLLIGGSWEIQSIVKLNKRCFKHCLCHLELGVLQQLKLLQGLHRQKIVYVSYSSHDKIKEQCCLLCIVLNFGQSKLHNPSGIFLCGNPYMHALWLCSYVHSLLSREIWLLFEWLLLWHPKIGVLQYLKLRTVKSTYVLSARLQRLTSMRQTKEQCLTLCSTH